MQCYYDDTMVLKCTDNGLYFTNKYPNPQETVNGTNAKTIADGSPNTKDPKISTPA